MPNCGGEGLSGLLPYAIVIDPVCGKGLLVLLATTKSENDYLSSLGISISAVVS